MKIEADVIIEAVFRACRARCTQLGMSVIVVDKYKGLAPTAHT